MKTKLFLIGLFAVCANELKAQLTLDAEIRPRYEYRNGFINLMETDQDPASFIFQRTRFNVNYKNENLQMYLSFQDYRTWGSESQLNKRDANLSIHQAWVDMRLTDNFRAKIGRQEINLDDQRIFGAVAWTQQARSQDALIFKYKKDKLKLDIGLAYNQDTDGLTGNTYYNQKNYKTFQYLWLHKDLEKMSASLLLLNNGLQYTGNEVELPMDTAETRYSQTIGTHLKGRSGDINWFANAYYQTGKHKDDRDINAYLIGAEAMYAPADAKYKVAIGGEIISGNDQTVVDGEVVDSDNEINAFNPFYGTNHKFNGWMDYFYVGNHADNVGLVDMYVKGIYKFNKKSNLMVMAHQFSSAGKIVNDGKEETMSFGTEIDMAFSHKLNSDVMFKVGYSQMFVEEGLEIVKDNFDGETNNWGWVMLVIKPTLFTSK